MKTLGPSLYAELRHNPSTYPVKLGGQLSLTMNERGGKEYYERHYTIYTERLKFVSWNALAIAELPIFLTIRTDMYASVGVGIAGFIVGNEKGRSYTSLCFMPRVGIDFNHRFRLALYYKAERKQSLRFKCRIHFRRQILCQTRQTFTIRKHICRQRCWCELLIDSSLRSEWQGGCQKVASATGHFCGRMLPGELWL